MSIPTIGVVVFPGSNCDRDAEAAWIELGFGNVKMLWHQDTDLTGIDAIIVPGGFSYGDALRAGAVAAMSPVMDAVADFAADGGPNPLRSRLAPRCTHPQCRPYVRL
jgi:phosphoribosylformylglycinamidine synthase